MSDIRTTNDLVAMNLQTIRRLRNITGNELATRIGVSPSALRKWEAGINDIKSSYIPLICDALDIDSSELFSNTLIDRLKLVLKNDEVSKNKIAELNEIGRCLENEDIDILITVGKALLNSKK